jgi:ribosomal protein S18 acetylase RimI-like enzyme
MVQKTAAIIDIPRDREAEAVEVLARAFEHDPSIQYFFPSDPDNPVRVRELFRFLCDVQFELGFSPLGCLHQGQLVGVAFVAEPADEPWAESLVDLWESFTASVGPETTRRLEAYGQLIDRLRPDEPHFYLDAIGVIPEAQGRGHGRQLLDAVHDLSESHPTSTGVALDTENQLNVPLYEHLGYHLITKAKLGELDVWWMFRPNGGKR